MVPLNVSTDPARLNVDPHAVSEFQAVSAVRLDSALLELRAQHVPRHDAAGREALLEGHDHQLVLDLVEDHGRIRQRWRRHRHHVVQPQSGKSAAPASTSAIAGSPPSPTSCRSGRAAVDEPGRVAERRAWAAGNGLQPDFPDRAPVHGEFRGHVESFTCRERTARPAQAQRSGETGPRRYRTEPVSIFRAESISRHQRLRLSGQLTRSERSAATRCRRPGSSGGRRRCRRSGRSANACGSTCGSTSTTCTSITTSSRPTRPTTRPTPRRSGHSTARADRSPMSARAAGTASWSSG